jgi:hypothetical protein
VAPPLDDAHAQLGDIDDAVVGAAEGELEVERLALGGGAEEAHTAWSHEQALCMEIGGHVDEADGTYPWLAGVAHLDVGCRAHQPRGRLPADGRRRAVAG